MLPLDRALVEPLTTVMPAKHCHDNPMADKVQGMSRSIVLAPLVALLLATGCSSGASTEELQRASAAGAAAAKAEVEASAAAEKAEAKASAAAAKKDAEAAKLKAEVDKLKAAQAKTAADAAKVSAAVDEAARAKVTASARAADDESCGDNVSASGTTSCSFALNVAKEWRYFGNGTTDVTAYSPVTREYISMHCVAGVPTVCRGGRAAVVYIR